jgi:predicted GNAT superfamily acetyltransferase
MTTTEITIRECETIDEMKKCVEIQRQVFASPDLEISPARHLLVTKSAGGWTLGAYAGERLVGFVLSVPMFYGPARALYSHMTAVDGEFQNFGIGARLKWAQRDRALAEGIRYIKWTFQPVLARNAFFNLERLGASISDYVPNFYGTDSESNAGQQGATGVDSDRLFAEWHLDSPKVEALANGLRFGETAEVRREIVIPADWNRLLAEDAPRAVAEQDRVRGEFEAAFAEGLVARGFRRSTERPAFLLY